MRLFVRRSFGRQLRAGLLVLHRTGLLLPISIILAMACGDDPVAPPQAPSLVVFPDTVRLVQFGSQQLAAAVVDSVGNPLSVTLGFTSGDPNIATVSLAGLVESVGPAGETRITVGGAGLTRQVPVVVAPVPSAVAVTPSSLRLPQGTNAQLTAVVLDAVGDTILDPVVTFMTGNGVVATVSSSGQVLALAIGVTQLTVTSGGISAVVSVTVVDAAIMATTSLAGRPFGVAVAASGAGYVLQQDLNSIARINLPSAQVVTSVSVGSDPTAAVFHPGGATAYVTNQFSGSVSIVNVATNVVDGTIVVGGNLVAVAIAPDGLVLWVTESSGNAFVIELGTASVIDTVAVGAAPNGIVFHPTDPIVYISAAGAGTVSEVSTTTNAVLRTFTVGGTPQGIAVAPDGSELYIANESMGLQIWDVVTGTSVATVGIGGGGFGLALSPDNARLAVTQPALGLVRFVDRVARNVAKTVEVGGQPRRVAFAPDGSAVVVPNEGGWFDIIAN